MRAIDILSCVRVTGGMEDRTGQVVEAEAAAVLGFDPGDPAFRADPYAHYRRLSPVGAASIGRTSASA